MFFLLHCIFLKLVSNSKNCTDKWDFGVIFYFLSQIFNGCQSPGHIRKKSVSKAEAISSSLVNTFEDICKCR